MHDYVRFTIVIEFVKCFTMWIFRNILVFLSKFSIVSPAFSPCSMRKMPQQIFLSKRLDFF